MDRDDYEEKLAEVGLGEKKIVLKKTETITINGKAI